MQVSQNDTLRNNRQAYNKILEDREFQVVLNDKNSQVKKLQNGFPYGSVLAPLFLSIYITELTVTNRRIM